MNKEKLATLLSQMLNNVKDGAVNASDFNHVHIFGGDELRISIGLPGAAPPLPAVPDPSEITQPAFSLTDDGVLALQEFVNECQKDGTILKVGKKLVIDEVEKLLRASNFGKDEAWDVIRSIRPLLKRLRERIQSYSVSMYIPALELQISESLIIGSVSFAQSLQKGQELYDGACEVLEGSLSPPKDREAGKQFMSQFLQMSMQGRGSIATVEVQASENTAYLYGLEEVRKSCALLQLYAEFLSPANSTCLIAPDADIVQKMPGYAVHTDATFSCQTHRVGLDYPLQIGLEEIEDMREHLLFDFFTGIYDRISRLDKEAEILATALWWHSRAAQSSYPAEAFVNYVISTERLLVSQSEATTSDRWCTRILWLLGTEDVNERRLLFDTLKRYYDMRSRVVHQGLELVDNFDVQALGSICRSVIVTYGRRSSEGLTQSQILSDLDGKSKGL